MPAMPTWWRQAKHSGSIDCVVSSCPPGLSICTPAILAVQDGAFVGWVKRQRNPPRPLVGFADAQSTLHVATHSPNTYSMVTLRRSFNSGVLMSRARDETLAPDAIATYCLPLTSKLMGGVVMPEPTLNFHNSSSVVSSKAATVPSSSATKTSPPPVVSAPA